MSGLAPFQLRQFSQPRRLYRMFQSSPELPSSPSFWGRPLGAPKRRSRAFERIRRWLKSIAVGGAATLADFFALLLLVEGFGFSPSAANFPALFAGAGVQFIGCRGFVFHARSGHLRRQVMGFALVELGTLLLNASVFQVLITATIPYPLARVLGQFLVFTCFSYPLWKRVFSR